MGPGAGAVHVLRSAGADRQRLAGVRSTRQVGRYPRFPACGAKSFSTNQALALFQKAQAAIKSIANILHRITRAVLAPHLGDGLIARNAAVNQPTSRSHRAARTRVVCDDHKAVPRSAWMRRSSKHFSRRNRVKVARGLIGQHQRRVHDQRTAMATRCCMPPDSSAGALSMAWPGPRHPAGCGWSRCLGVDAAPRP